MDIFNLNEKVEGLVSYLQETGYSAMYIGYVKKMAEWLSENANHYKWQSFSDVEPTLKRIVVQQVYLQEQGTPVACNLPIH